MGSSPNLLYVYIICIHEIKVIGRFRQNDSSASIVGWRIVAEEEHLDKIVSQTFLESAAKEGESPVGKNDFMLLGIFPEYHRNRKPGGNSAELTAKAKYYPITDSEQSTVRERWKVARWGRWNRTWIHFAHKKSEGRRAQAFTFWRRTFCTTSQRVYMYS